MKLLLAVFLLILGCVLMAAFLLGASVLDRDLPSGLDAGVAAAAVSLIVSAIGPAMIATPGAGHRALSRIALFAAIAWLPVSIALAGGLQLSYSGWRSIAWLVLTGFVLLALLGSWVMALAGHFRSSE